VVAALVAANRLILKKKSRKEAVVADHRVGQPSDITPFFDSDTVPAALVVADRPMYRRRLNLPPSSSRVMTRVRTCATK
jgi:hypothetical protein